MLDLESAIKHCEKVASGHERNCEIFTDDSELYAINREWADNYCHITEWLKKLKTYQEGINEIKNKASEYFKCGYLDTANGMEFALELLGVENEETNS